VTAGLALLGLLGCSGPPERIVLITVDTLRADHVGAYGAPEGATPILDHVARQGLRFETAISPTPLTLPSHSSLMTGLDPLEHGVHHNGSFRLPDDATTLAESLRAGGYASAAFIGALVLDRVFGLDQGFDVYDDQMRGRHAAGGGGWAERPADQVVSAALEWLESAPPRFFLWVHLYDPHAFYEPPPPFDERFEPYAGEIAFADREIGRLLAKMGERFSLSDSLIVITSDHGESLGEHFEETHGLALYDATQHVPLIFAGRGVPAGRVVETPVRLVDVAPTLLALAELPPLPETVGRDLTPWMRGGGGDPAPAYLETFATRLDLEMSPLLGLRSPRYKYVYAPEPELYDLEADPQELHNLATEQPRVALRLEQALLHRIDGAPPVRPNLQLDDTPRAMLESLGYVVAEPPAREIPVGSREGPDPKQARASFKRFHDAALQRQAGLPEAARATLETTEGGGFHRATELASAALEQGDLAAAEQHARSAIESHPFRAQGYFLLGESLREQGRADEAREAYAASLRLQPERGLTFLRLGEIAEREGDLERAARLYDRAAAARDPIPAAREKARALRD
jgi:arylsulfatase A-like enzyme